MAAASLGLVGSATAFATNTVTIPVGITIPRTDPVSGATIIVVTLICDDAITPLGPFAIVDDAPTDPFYNTCLVTSGLNSYVGAPWIVGLGTDAGSPRADGGWMGLVTNPLDASNSIVVTAGSVQDYLFAFAVAYTGISCDYSGPGGFSDAAGVFAACGAPPLGESECGITVHEGVAWSYLSGFSLDQPSGCATPTSWEWVQEGIAVYMLWSSNIHTPPTGPNTWADTDIVTLEEFDDVTTGVSTNSYSYVYAEQAVTAGETGIDLSSSWLNPGGLNQAFTIGGGSLLVAGPGPTCTSTPPVTAGPIFSNRFRAA